MSLVYVFAFTSNMDKFVISTPLPTKVVAVDSYDRVDSDSVSASKLEEEQLPLLQKSDRNIQPAAASMMSKIYTKAGSLKGGKTPEKKWGEKN